jgi:protein-disulfide isomerase
MAKKSPTSTPRKSSKPLSEKETKRSSNRTILWIAIAAAAVLVVALILVAVINQPKASTSADPGVSVSERVNQPVDRKTIGNPESPVLIEVYEDFQCPHCQRFNADMEDTILDELVAPGIARYSYKHRFVIGPDSLTAGMATECAADQGMFWEYHDALFAAIVNDSRAVATGNLKDLAESLGMDTAQFNRCMDSKEHYDLVVRADIEAGEQGINSTPTVLINGERYQGAFEPEAFKAAVQAAAEANS